MQITAVTSLASVPQDVLLVPKQQVLLNPEAEEEAGHVTNHCNLATTAHSDSGLLGWPEAAAPRGAGWGIQLQKLPCDIHQCRAARTREHHVSGLAAASTGIQRI